MFTPADILFMVLAFCVLLLTVFVIVLITNVTRILRNVSRITERVDDLTFSLNNFVKMPLQVMGNVVEKVQQARRAAKTTRGRKVSDEE